LYDPPIVNVQKYAGLSSFSNCNMTRHAHSFALILEQLGHDHEPQGIATHLPNDVNAFIVGQRRT